jgi:hypothetical protein
MERIDVEMKVMIARHGVAPVLAALCRAVSNMEWQTPTKKETLFHKLNAVYEWTQASGEAKGKG